MGRSEDLPHGAPAPVRIAVVGTTGSGKTTLARRLAQLYAVPHIEIDALHWEPNWTPAPRDVVRQRVAGAISAPGWVSDGNYTSMLGFMQARAAQIVVWLDYPIRVNLWRLFWRTARRAASREELWNANRESLRTGFFSRESLFVWALKTHWRHRRDFAARFARPDMADTRLVRLRSAAQTEAWLRRVELSLSATRTAPAETKNPSADG